MFKKLDKLILKAFIGPFVATFFITVLVLLMQFFWLYIDDFVGKGLDASIIFKFIWYQSAALVPLALPLAILLSSLMTFGSLGESFELVAIKSSGISLLRFMRPLFIVSIFVTGIAFLFSNFIIPVAYLKSRTLLSDIVYAKPAFDLKEGEFYDKLSGFAIKIGKKEANDSVIRDVIVYEQTNPIQDNFIIAKSGIMRISENKRYLEFNLKDGWRYQERANNSGNIGTEYIRLGFNEYKKQFDLSSFMLRETPDSNNRQNERVYSMRQLNKAIDSIAKANEKIRTQLKSTMYTSAHFLKYRDSSSTKKLLHDSSAGKTDSIWNAAKTFDQLLPDSARANVLERARDKALSMGTTLDAIQINLKAQERVLRKHKIEWHRKLILSFACMILFLIGAPLGSIIRKGGLGTPMVVAIIFFMVFYFSTTMGEKLGKENTVPPWAGMWLAAFILVPIGIFLTYKAMRDSQLFNKEWYHRAVKTFRKFVRRKTGQSSSA
jgi:lipopolysaccharide export system permease protein